MNSAPKRSTDLDQLTYAFGKDFLLKQPKIKSFPRELRIFKHILKMEFNQPGWMALQMLQRLYPSYDESCQLVFGGNFFDKVFFPRFVEIANILDRVTEISNEISNDPLLLLTESSNFPENFDVLKVMFLILIAGQCATVMAHSLENSDEAFSYQCMCENFQMYLDYYVDKNKNNVNLDVLVRSEFGRLGGNARAKKFSEIKEFARKLATERRYPSRRNAARTIAPRVLEEAKRIGLSLSESQIEITITNWIKDVVPARKHIT